MSLESLGICQAVELLKGGNISSTQLVDACIARIETHEPDIHAWAWHQPEFVRSQAKAMDDLHSRSKSTGRLHGIPIGIKDIIDTALVPTEYGCPLFAGRLPKSDATLVARLKQQGAIIMGKTETAKLASMVPAATTNPHNHAHTPGGSSSGSAAAVASFMAPGAVGTQTVGSVIRPAAFCGTVGYKPSYGLIPRTGVLRQSPFLDQVGVFSRSVEDAALLAEVMMGADENDSSTLTNTIVPPINHICLQEPPLPPRFAFVKTAIWSKAEQETQEALAEVVAALGGQVEELELSQSFASVWEWVSLINAAEMATWYQPIYARFGEQVDDVIKQQIERGRTINVPDYLNAMAQRVVLNNILDEYFDNFDALITPAAIGTAPSGLESTGDPAFCATWSFCGVPSVTLPLLEGENGLPIGVQLIGNVLDDGRLLRTARWLHQHLMPQSD